MSTHIQDPALAGALERALGRTGPYPDAELESVRELRIVGAGALDELARCTGLERLVLVGCDVTDLRGVTNLKLLRTLHVLACPVASADGLIGLDRLEELRLDFAFLEDASPLFALPSLRRARLLGNPWSGTSWKQLQHHALPPPGGVPAARPILDLGADSDTVRKATRRFREFGLALCSAALDEFRTVTVRPGKARVPGNEFDWTVASPNGGLLKTKEHWTTDTLFDTVHARRTARGDNAAFDFETHCEYGDREDALQWITAEDDPGRRASLQRFIERFPGAVFFREDDAFHALVERQAGVSLPASHRAARRILAGAFRWATFRVDRFARDTVAERLLEEAEVWYRTQCEDYTSDEGPTIRDVARLYPFARWSEPSNLAVSLDGDQPDILAYGEESLFFELRRGNPSTSAVYRVYSSYSELLSHIVAFKLPGDIVIEATVSPSSE